MATFEMTVESGVAFPTLITASLLLLALVIGIRIVWIVGTALLARWRWRHRRPTRQSPPRRPRSPPRTTV